EHHLGDTRRQRMRRQEDQHRHQQDDADNRSQTLHDIEHHRAVLESDQSANVTVFRFKTLSREAAKPRTRLPTPAAWLTTNKTGPGPSLAAISWKRPYSRFCSAASPVCRAVSRMRST